MIPGVPDGMALFVIVAGVVFWFGFCSREV
jgi:hypothetical protein